jgi:hypothetical protein
MKSLMRIITAAILVFATISLTFSVSTGKTASTVLSSYPASGAKYAPAATSIGIRYAGTADLAESESVAVKGSKSGVHSGRISYSADHHTLIFTPDLPFTPSETVSVSAPSASYSFTIAETPDPTATQNFHSDDPITEAILHPAPSAPASIQSMPTIDVLTNTNPAPGDFYLTNLQFMGIQKNTNYFILNNDAQVTFSHAAGKNYALDFHPWKNGTYTYFDAYFAVQKYFILDSNLTVIDSLKAANGLQTDGHELMYTADGGYLMLALQNVKMDMRQFNEFGNANATVLNCVIQEFDKDRNLVFEWSSLDHFKVTDAIFLDFTLATIDYCHANAIELDADGNILLSSRHMDEITKINRKTGQIIWRLGGLNNQFAFTNDTIQFSHQHDIRRTPAGTYTLFDNGNLHTNGGIFSRAMEYKIDEIEMTVTKQWEFRHSPDVFGEAMGSVQRLPNGNTLICWGACDTVSMTEVDAANKTAFEIKMEDQNYGYRAYKYTKADLQAGVSVVTQANGISVSCFPNPIVAKATVSLAASNDEQVSVKIYDDLGREVSSVFTGRLTASKELPIDASQLSNGIYHLQVSGETGSVGREMVVMK